MRAGQLSPPSPSAANPPATTAVSPQTVETILQQFAGSLVAAARTDLLPALQQDRALQQTIGAAIGRELAKPLWVLAGVGAVYVGWQIWRHAGRRR